MGHRREVFEVAKRLMNGLPGMLRKSLSLLGNGFTLLPWWLVQSLSSPVWWLIHWLSPPIRWLIQWFISPRVSGLITLLGVVAAAVAIWLTYQSLLKHDVEIAIYEPSDSQYVAGSIVVRGSVAGWPYDRVSVELASTEIAWEGFPFVLDTTQLPEGEHQLLCRVYRGSVLVREKAHRFFVRNAPPSVSILHPRDGDVLSGEIAITVEAEETAQRVQILLDGERPLTRSVLNTLGLPDGYHTLTAIVVGPSELSGVDTVGFVVENTPPRIMSLGMERGTLVSGTVVLRPEIEEQNISSVTWYVDEVFVGNNAPLSLDTRRWPDGERSIKLEVQDKVDQGDSMVIPFYVDNTPPVVLLWSLEALPEAMPRSASVFVDVIAQDESGIAQITHHANGQIIDPGWFSLAQFPSGATIRIRHDAVSSCAC